MKKPSTNSGGFRHTQTRRTATLGDAAARNVREDRSQRRASRSREPRRGPTMHISAAETPGRRKEDNHAIHNTEKRQDDEGRIPRDDGGGRPWDDRLLYRRGRNALSDFRIRAVFIRFRKWQRAVGLLRLTRYIRERSVELIRHKAEDGRS